MSQISTVYIYYKYHVVRVKIKTAKNCITEQMYYFLICSIISVGHFCLAISEVLIILAIVFVGSFRSFWSFSWFKTF